MNLNILVITDNYHYKNNNDWYSDKQKTEK